MTSVPAGRAAPGCRGVGTSLAAALLLVIGAACSRTPTTTTMVPAVRVLDILEPSRDARLLRATDVAFERDSRISLFVPAASAGLFLLEGTGAGAHYRASFIPDAPRAWGRVQLVREVEVESGKHQTFPLRVDLTSGMPDVPSVVREVLKPRMPVGIYPALPRTTAVDTRPFRVPAGAVLAFDVAAHAPGPRPRLFPVARIVVVEGTRRQLAWRARLPGWIQGWHPDRVSLAQYAGRTIRLRFMSHVGPEASDAGMLSLFGEPVVLAPEPRPTPPLNVVLVSMDTLRARGVGVLGAERPTTPTLDAFAGEGTLFENAFSTAAFTLPGHMSMLTGLWFRTHDVITPSSLLGAEHRTLAEAMRAAGYATAAFTSGAWIMPWTGFRRGFDAYNELAPGGYMTSQPGGIPYEAFTRGLAWLRANADRPCFVFLHSYMVHSPYPAPPPYDHLFDPLPVGAPDAERFRLRYEQTVRYADDQIRALLEGLDALGIAGRTLVLITADHGEQFGEHGGMEHTYDVHDEVAHIPMLMRLPGAIPAGRHVTEPVSLADVVPTILDVTGVPPIHGVDGASLLPLATGTATQLARAGVFTEAASAVGVDHTDLVAVRTRTHTCIHDERGDRLECYDRRTDPWERTSLSPEDGSPERRGAEAVLAQFRASMPPPGAPRPTPPAEGTPPEAPTSAAPPIDPERRQQLRALGYVE